jgi:hypothetical protein
VRKKQFCAEKNCINDVIRCKKELTERSENIRMQKKILRCRKKTFFDLTALFFGLKKILDRLLLNDVYFK